MLPTQFMQKYKSISVHTQSEWKYVPIRRYVSGEPRKKKFVKEAFWDFECFVKKRDRYKPEYGRFTGHHEWHSDHFVGDTLVPKTVPISWSEMALCFYGKGSPATFRSMLHVVAHYLKCADISHDRMGWSRRVTLDEYAEYYLGLDCNGFAGAYYAARFPEVGIDGGDHINYLDTRAALEERESFAAIRPGDILVCEGAGGHRHVALIEWVGMPTGKTAKVKIVHSASSRGGLTTQEMTMEHRPGKTYEWDLKHYKEFHKILGRAYL